MPWVWWIITAVSAGLGVVSIVKPNGDAPVEEVVEPVVDTVATTDISLMSYIALVGLLTLVIYLIFSFFRKK